MKQVLTVVAVMLLLAMPCRAAGEPEQVEGLDELWQAAESYGVEPDGDLSGGLSGLAEQALGQAGELLRRSAQTGLKLLAVAVFCGLAEGVYAGKREGGLQAVQMAGTLAVTALSVSDMQTMIGLGRQTIEQMDGFAGLLLPVVAVLTAATGAATGAAVRQGATVLFSDLLIGAIDTLLVPIVYAYVAVCAAHAAVGNEGLKKLASVLKWVVTSLLTAVLLAFGGHRRLGRRRRDQDSQNGHLSGRPGGRRHPGRRGGDRAGGGRRAAGDGGDRGDAGGPGHLPDPLPSAGISLPHL